MYRLNGGAHSWYNAISGSANAAITFTQAMTLTAAGSLGLGIATPSTLLHIASSSASFFTIDAGTSSNSGISFYRAGSPFGAIYYLSTNTMRFDVNNAIAMLIDSNANTSIGYTTNPSLYKLDVNGTGRFTATSSTPALKITLVANANATLLSSVDGSGYGWELQQEEVSTGDFRIFRSVASTKTQVLNLARSTGAATFSSSVTAGGNILGASIIMTPVTANPSSTSPALYQPATGELGINVNGSERIRIASTGAATFSSTLRATKLSLGTATTTYPINVEDATQSNSYFTLFNTIGTAGATAGLRFGIANGTLTTGGAAEIVARGLTAADAAMDLKVMYNYSLVTALTLGSNGAATFSSSVTATQGFFNGFATNGTPSSAGTAQNFVEFRNTGGDFYIGQEGSVAGNFFTGSSAYASVFYGSTAQEFIIGGVRRLQIASTGAATFSSSVTATSFFSTTGCNFATSSGSVNINNTTNTTYKLSTYNNVEDTHVLIAGLAPSVRFKDTVTSHTYSSLFGMATIANNFITGSAAGDFAITWESTKKCFFGYTNTTAIMVLDNGNLGLGTLTIGSKAQINGNMAVGYSASTAAPTNGILSNGGFKSSAPAGASAATWKLGNIANTTVTHDRVLYVEIDGTTYSILASTTI